MLLRHACFCHRYVCSACPAQHRDAECNPNQLLIGDQVESNLRSDLQLRNFRANFALYRIVTISESLHKPIAPRGCTPFAEAQVLLRTVDLAKDERAALFSAIALYTACGAHFAADTSPQQTQVPLHRSRQGPSASESCQG